QVGAVAVGTDQPHLLPLHQPVQLPRRRPIPPPAPMQLERLDVALPRRRQQLVPLTLRRVGRERRQHLTIVARQAWRRAIAQDLALGSAHEIAGAQVQYRDRPAHAHSLRAVAAGPAAEAALARPGARSARLHADSRSWAQRSQLCCARTRSPPARPSWRARSPSPSSPAAAWAKASASSASSRWRPSSKPKPSAPTRVEITAFSIASASRILMRLPPPIRSGTTTALALPRCGRTSSTSPT